MDEKLLQKIRESAETLPIPGDLQPDAVKAALKKAEEQKQTPKQQTRKPFYRRRGFLCSVAAAALFVLVIGVAEGAFKEHALPVSEVEDCLTFADSYEEIYEKLLGNQQAVSEEGDKTSSYGTVPEAGLMQEAALEQEEAGMPETATDVADMELMTGNTGTEDYSQTNIQTEGVDEGDIVKTDGTYLYVLKQGEGIQIVRAEDLILVSQAKWPDAAMQAQEMYVDGDRLTVIGTVNSTTLSPSEDGLMEDVSVMEHHQEIHAVTYDISNRSRPEQEGIAAVEGAYLTTRKNGDYLYLFSRYLPNLEEAAVYEDYVPEAGGSLLPLDAIYLPKEEGAGATYLVAVSVDLRRPDAIVDSCAVVTDSQEYYVSRENIYTAAADYRGGAEVTDLVRFSYQHGQITAEDAGTIPGYLQSNFAMDEYEGHLRTVTSQWKDGENTTGLYILDKNMQVVGSIEELAPGEDLKSVRFLGEQGYFVTFLETDPLFSADLSDPSNPRILGELKIPGFSSYLHPFEEDLLLGIGWEDSEAGYREVKLSMFDVGDPADVKEMDKTILKDAVDCPGTSFYKSILVQPQKKRFGLAYGCREKGSWEGQENYYSVFDYTEQGFVEVFTCALNEDENFGDNPYYLNDVRGVTIEERLYLVLEQGISVYDLSQNGKKTGSLSWTG